VITAPEGHEFIKLETVTVKFQLAKDVYNYDSEQHGKAGIYYSKLIGNKHVYYFV
jgi:hypothetical protein